MDGCCLGVNKSKDEMERREMNDTLEVFSKPTWQNK